MVPAHQIRATAYLNDCLSSPTPVAKLRSKPVGKFLFVAILEIVVVHVMPEFMHQDIAQIKCLESLQAEGTNPKAILKPVGCPGPLIFTLNMGCGQTLKPLS